MVYEYLQSTASTACTRCTRSKKRCDKATPSCHRCSRLNYECAYASEVSTVSKPLPQNTKTIARIGASRGSPYHVAHSVHPLPAFPPLGDYVMTTLASGLHQHIKTCVFELLEQENVDIGRCCQIYFSVVYLHFPVIDRKDFMERLAYPSHEAQAHTSLVLLCIVAAVQSSITRDEPGEPGTFYYTAKSLHAVLSSTDSPSIELIQAGVLLAHYEYTHALFQVATLSVKRCVEMGFVFGLAKSLSEVPTDNQLMQPTVVEIERSIWWSVFTLERMIALHNLKNKPVFMCRNPNPSYLLPLNISAPQHRIGDLMASYPNIMPIAPDDACPTLYRINAQTAQAAYLLDLVIELIFNNDLTIESKISGATVLDTQLQLFLSSLIEQPRDESVDACGPYSVILSAMFTLLNFKLRLCYSSSQFAGESITVLLAIKSLVSMGVETINLGNPKVFEDLLIFPLWTTHWAFATLEFIKTIVEIFPHCAERTRQITIVEKYFGIIESKWRIGAYYLNRLSKSDSCKLQKQSPSLSISPGGRQQELEALHV